MKNKKYSFIDLETTGLDPDKDQIIEVGIVKTAIPYKNECEYVNFFVKLEKIDSLPAEITALTGIKEDDLKKGKTLQEAYNFIADFIKDTTVVCHNVPFDLSFMKDIEINDFYCTLAMSKLIFPNVKHGLKSMIEFLGIKHTDNMHRALYDAYSTVMLFNRLCHEAYNFEFYKNKIVYREDRYPQYVPANAIMVLEEKK